MHVHLDQCPTLVLNADFRPLSYFPLSLWSWQDAIKAVFMDRVNIISEYDREVHSPSMAMKIPSVIALKDYVTPPNQPAFTRFNVFLRDKWQWPILRGHTQNTGFDVRPRHPARA